MPKYNFMISKAVDLVARKLAGMDPDTVARLTQVLSEEAQMISEELQYSGENVNSDILAARLEGVVARMKYEIRNQGPDPSPNEFPIFNVSHNPISPYPNPINHLYDKRYKEAYSTFIKQNQPATSTPTKSEPSTPTSPSSTQATTNPQSLPYSSYPQGPFSKQSNKPTSPSSTQATTNPQFPSYPSYPQGQFPKQSNKPTSQTANVVPSFRQQPTGGWSYINPYATMPRSHAAHYQQQASKIMQPIQEQPSTTNDTQRIRHSSTGEDLRSHSLSRSASSNDLNYSTNSGTEKIRVRVINDNSSSSSTDPQTNPYSNNRSTAQRSILKSKNDSRDNKETVTTRTIYTSPGTDIGTETMEDLFKVVNNHRSEPSGSSSSPPIAERIIIIDRRGGSNTPDNNQNSSGQERYRTFEIRSSTAAATPSTTAVTPSTAVATPLTVTPVTTTVAHSMPTTSPSPAALPVQQPTYYTGQPIYYQQPKMYSSVPSNLYSAATPYVLGANHFYPFTYYRY